MIQLKSGEVTSCSGDKTIWDLNDRTYMGPLNDHTGNVNEIVELKFGKALLWFIGKLVLKGFFEKNSKKVPIENSEKCH